jgi:hypothetical protein
MRRSACASCSRGLGSLRGAIGTPDQIRDLSGATPAAGVDQVVFVLQAGRNRHEHICESLETFGAEVMPEFAARPTPSTARATPSSPRDRRRPAPPRAARERGHRLHDRADRVGPPAGADGRRGHRHAPAARGAAARRREHGEQAFRAFVRRASDERLEATGGSDRGPELVFGAMARPTSPTRRTASPASCSTS